MNTVSNYRSKTRREVTLSDGTKLQVRPLTVTDFLEIGDIPAGFVSAAGTKEATEQAAVDPKFYDALMRTVLLKCVVGPNDFRIVDSPPHQCGENEISFNEIITADATAIMNEVVCQTSLK